MLRYLLADTVRIEGKSHSRLDVSSLQKLVCFLKGRGEGVSIQQLAELDLDEPTVSRLLIGYRDYVSRDGTGLICLNDTGRFRDEQEAMCQSIDDLQRMLERTKIGRMLFYGFGLASLILIYFV